MTDHPNVTRRETLIFGVAALTSMMAQGAGAEEAAERHGISAFGDLKYPPDFKQFDYVDPNAPKGGTFSYIGSNLIFNQNGMTFNSLNSFILKGDAAQGMELTFASLMVRAADEPDALYGLAARAVRISEDGLTYRFLMRPGIKFHDGSPLTAHDVAFSLTLLKEKGHPVVRQLLRDCASAEALDDATVVVRFAPNRARDVAVVRCIRSDLLTDLLFQPSVRRDDTRSAARVRPLQGRAVRGRSLHRVCTGQGLVGRRFAGRARPAQLRHRPL